MSDLFFNALVGIVAVASFFAVFLPVDRLITRRWVLRRNQATNHAEHDTHEPDVPLIDRIESVARDIQAGMSPAYALQEFEISACNQEDLSFISGAVRAAQKAGPGAVTVLQNLAEGLRRRDSARKLCDAQAATAMASAKVLTLLPVLAGGLMCLLDARVRGFLIGSRPGWMCIALAAALNQAARKVMARIIAGKGTGAALPEVVDAICIGLAVTGTMTGAISWSVSDGGCTSLVGCEDVLRMGGSFNQALDRMQTDLGAESAPLVAAMRAHHRDGLPISPTLERIRSFALERQERASEVIARRLPVRLSFPLVILILPAFALVTIVPLLAGALSSLGAQLN